MANAEGESLDTHLLLWSVLELGYSLRFSGRHHRTNSKDLILTFNDFKKNQEVEKNEPHLVGLALVEAGAVSGRQQESFEAKEPGHRTGPGGRGCLRGRLRRRWNQSQVPR